MPLHKLLIANRGEIAIRIMHAAAELGIATVGIHSEDDGASLHTRRADEARTLKGRGAAAYLDAGQILALAEASGCDGIHPGYGFLSEQAAFARRCAERGIQFVGPSPEALALFGDKAQARALATRCGVPVPRGTGGPTDLAQARAFFAQLAPGTGMMVKALGGGGGRGIRWVRRAEEIEEAFALCRAEAAAAFGSGELYVEQWIGPARHIEVQVAGDGTGAVTHLWERDCSVQRRHQKLVEIAPAPALPPALRDRLLAAAVRMAQEVRYGNLGTFEFLVEAATEVPQAPFFFIEANPRLQVEHTVTEQVTGIDLVKLQLRLAAGASLAEAGVAQQDVPAPRGFAVQARVNAETMGRDGAAKPSGGVLTAFEIPFGPGIRVDTCGYVGYRTNPNFDSLLAKVIGHSAAGTFEEVAARTYRALCEFRIGGVPTNLPLLQSVLQHPDFRASRIHTRFVEERIGELLGVRDGEHPRLFFEMAADAGSGPRRAGARVDAVDPLAVLDYGREARADSPAAGAAPAAVPEESAEGQDAAFAVRAPIQGTVVSIDVSEGAIIAAGKPLLVMEAMKMQHSIPSDRSGIVRRIAVAPGDTVYEGHPLVYVEESAVEVAPQELQEHVDPDAIRPDLAELLERQKLKLDAMRPDAVAKRRKTGQRTARENVDDLCDAGTFVEYGSLVVAARRNRMPLEELIRRTPADGLITGLGRVNGHLFEGERARCAIVSYDYTVLAGTQGKKNHQKKDRIFEIAADLRAPLVFFTEGGGGRPGDTDVPSVAGLWVRAFNLFARLSGLVPLVGITSGRCFAGNAALLGCCDVVIAAADSSIGMGGPAMIEGGGLGVFRPEEVGPMSVQVPNGVVDIPVADEAEAVRVAKRYLSYFQGPLKEYACADQRLLRQAIPENRLRVYDVRRVIETLADRDSVIEIRRAFGPGMVTALARIEGLPVGIVANNPMHLAGAIDSNGADKASRFMQLCDAFGIPLVFLCDTPGMMVGPEVEKTALVRHCCRMFVTGANLSVPFVTVVLRKAYGLGAQAMAGGCFHTPVFSIAWPTGEFGGMGLEGSVKLGFRDDLAAIADPIERKAQFDRMVAEAYARGKAVSTATYFEIDEVIDPADTRHWILTALRATPPRHRDMRKMRPNIDAW